MKRAVPVAVAVFVVGLAVVPARRSGADDPWYGLTSSDAIRYLALTEHRPVEYPWGGRWAVPELAGILPFDAVTSLRLVDYAFLLAALIAISLLAVDVSASVRGISLSWLFAATGGALPLLFQNPFLVDSAALFVFAAIGLAYLRGNFLVVAVLIPVGVTAKEVTAGFLILLALQRRWAGLAASLAASVLLLLYGRARSEPGEPLLPDFGPSMIVKIYFGLGASWLLLAGIALLAIGSRSNRRTRTWPDSLRRRDVQYWSVTALLVAASLPVATDSTRLMVFALPLTIPITARLLGGVSTRASLVLAAACVPAALFIVPTRATLFLKPASLSQLEEWYAQNALAILAVSVLAMASAVTGAILGGRSRSARQTVDTA